MTKPIYSRLNILRYNRIYIIYAKGYKDGKTSVSNRDRTTT